MKMTNNFDSIVISADGTQIVEISTYPDVMKTKEQIQLDVGYFGYI